ncbi:MAG: hypothetical protein ACLFOC_06740 [Campylobacterales bacterium]
MGINNRQRRKEKQVRLKKKKQQNRKVRKTTSSDSGLQFLENPFANISETGRKVIFNEIQKVNEKNYKESLEKLQELFKEYSPLAILSFMSSYGLTVGIRKNKIESHNRKISQANVEVCQALILQIEAENLENKAPMPDILQNILELSEKLLKSNQFKDINSSIFDLSTDKYYIEYIRSLVIGYTQIVRNWGNYNQVKNISRELYSNLDDLLIGEYNFTTSNLIEFFSHLVKTIEDRNTITFNVFAELKKINSIEEMIYRYYELANLNKLEAEELISYLKNKGVSNHEDIFMLLYSYHTDRHLPTNYIFNCSDVARELTIDEKIVISILETFSYRFGSLKDKKTEHLFLDNPIWTKPIILISAEEFFCPMPQLFFSFILKSFDNLIVKIDKNKLSDVKAEYLENKIEEIVKTRFPDENTVRSIKWWGVEDGKEKEFETDLITFIDVYAIIFEAKSGKITDSALRGSPDRLKKKINELLIEPNIQSKRLKEKLELLIKNPNINDELRQKLPVDLNKIRKVLRVSVTLEDFASLQSNIYELKETGWIPEDYNPCPTMNIADFETVFDIFENPTQIINYLEVREELESVIKYKGDELDLVAVYMENHLNLAEINPEVSLIITGMSNKIDEYYQLIAFNQSIEKPKPKMNKYFEKILIQIEERKPEGWVQLGSAIYRLYPDDQLKIVNMLKKIKNYVSKNWRIKGHNNILNYVPPKSSNYAFVFIVFCENNKGKKKDFLEEAIAIGLETEHVEYCLGIGINIDRSDMPYAIIGMSEKLSQKSEPIK